MIGRSIIAVIVLACSVALPAAAGEWALGVFASGGAGIGFLPAANVLPSIGADVFLSYRIAPIIGMRAHLQYEFSVSEVRGTVLGIDYAAASSVHRLRFGITADVYVSKEWHAGTGILYAQGIAGNTTVTTNGAMYQTSPAIGVGNFAALAAGGYDLVLNEHIAIPFELRLLWHIASPFSIDLIAAAGVQYRFASTAAEKTPDTAPEHYRPAVIIPAIRKLVQEKNRVEAERILDKALSLYPNDKELLLIRSIIKSTNVTFLEMTNR